MKLPWPKELMQSKQWEKCTVAPLVATHKHTLPANSNDKDTKGFSPASKPVIQLDVTSLSLVSMLTFHSAGLQPRDHHTCGAVCAFKATGFHFYLPFFFFFLGDFLTNQCATYPSIFWDWLGGRSQTPLYFAHWLRPTNQPKHIIKKICWFFFC